MKKIYALQTIITLMLLFILPCSATAQHKFNKIKSFAQRTAPIHEGYMDVIHLDSVISEQEHVYYTYNEFGYLSSQKTYRLEEGEWVFTCGPTDLGTVSEALGNAGKNVTGMKLISVPQNPTMISDVAVARKVMKLYDLLDDYDDTMNVFANFEIDEAVLEQL